MASKIIFFCMLFALTGCEGQPINGCLALPAPPQVLVNLNDGITGEQILNAQVKVNLLADTANQTYDAVFIANPAGDGGIYKALPDTSSAKSQVNVSVVAKGYSSYQSKSTLLKNDAACGAENVTRFTIRMCPVNAVCE